MNDDQDVFCRFTSRGLTQASTGQGGGPTCLQTPKNGIDWILGTAGLTLATTVWIGTRWCVRRAIIRSVTSACWSRADGLYD